MNSDPTIDRIYHWLFEAYGAQHWWPAQSPFEIVVGAVLVQNTAWRNVELALQNLREAGRLSLEGVLSAQTEELKALIRPSGFYRVKSKRLVAVCSWLADTGGIGGCVPRSTLEIRESLLGVHGVGEETADAILLYALERPMFVVDTYTRRLFSRYGVITGGETYTEIQSRVEHDMRPDVEAYKEFHALIVAHGKAACRRRARCAQCCLNHSCHYGITNSNQ